LGRDTSDHLVTQLLVPVGNIAGNCLLAFVREAPFYHTEFFALCVGRSHLHASSLLDAGWFTSSTQLRDIGRLLFIRRHSYAAFGQTTHN
jgi:hypothetical protein